MFSVIDNDGVPQPNLENNGGVGWRFKNKATDRLASRNEREGLKLPFVKVKSRSKMNKLRSSLWGFHFLFITIMSFFCC